MSVALWLLAALQLTKNTKAHKMKNKKGKGKKPPKKYINCIMQTIRTKK